MLKLLVGVVAGVIGFLVAFSFANKEEIAGEVAVKLASDFERQCVRRLGRGLPNPDRADDVCGCMKAEFDTRGLAISDAFGKHLGEMRQVTESCVQLFG